MGKKAMDTDLLDRAMIFAINAHKGIGRNGKGFPYVVHPLEAVSIVASMTDDMELLCAAALHDVVEDTEYTVEDIRAEFGDRVAELVHTESDIVVEGMNETESWHIRKQAAMDRLKAASMDAKMVAMGDKLSNLRTIYRDYRDMGDDLWNIFHVKDRRDHEWHYRGLMESLSDLEGTVAYTEFKHILYEIFSEEVRENLSFDAKMASEMFKEYGVNKDTVTRLDFTYIKYIRFSGIRALIKAQNEGYKFRIVNVGNSALGMLFFTGIAKDLDIVKKPGLVNMEEWVEEETEITSKVYSYKTGGANMVLYDESVDLEEVENEKMMSLAVSRMGIPSAISGGLVRHNKQYGIVFEKILNGMSFSKVLTEFPERIEELSKNFANVCRKLHNTPCNIKIFEPAYLTYGRIVSKTDFLDYDSKKKIFYFINRMPKKLTCLHGLLSVNTVGMKDDEMYFLDLSDFSYGYYMFDIGMLYLTVFIIEEERQKNVLHCPRELLEKMWKYFVEEYFPDTSLEKVNEKVAPYVGLCALYLDDKYKFDKKVDVKKIVQEYLLDRI